MLRTHVPVPAGGKTPADGKGNQANYYLSEIWHMCKVQLRKTMELMQMEINQLTKTNHEKDLKIEQLIRERDLYLNRSIESQEKILELQDKILNFYGIEDKPYMRVAE